ncbi:hypothetical protein TSOC_014617 [Tetrabaena socialis]|uniref:Uncharacterized protein n=1 Tax=Tetrabaena socialis TaxID=47790 RepID=A0A2J7ZH54_9CHLO|nr:hypothetical protein TSOC_014617 [Tetrabaena socialis]|eukprot:PNG99600.1 hypothetical protein TSOC_014617 [Tetrabaena socialis]
MLTLKAFQPASDKVRQAEFHPVLPWIVSATKSDHVCVWDWRTKQDSPPYPVTVGTFQYAPAFVWPHPPPPALWGGRATSS